MGSAIAEPCYVYVVCSECVRPGCRGYVFVRVLYLGVRRCKDSTIEARLVKKLGILLHALATGLIAKYNAKGYHHCVSALDFLLFHPDKFTAPIKTTPCLFLKNYCEFCKLLQLQEPTMPVQEMDHIWHLVNIMAPRDTTLSAASPGQNTIPGNPTATAAASKSPLQTTPVKRTSPDAGGTVVASAHANAPVATRQFSLYILVRTYI